MFRGLSLLQAALAKRERERERERVLYSIQEEDIEWASFPPGGHGRQADAQCGVCGLINKLLKYSNAPSDTIWDYV